MKTLRELLKEGEARLAEHGIENSTMEARILLQHICDFDWARYLIQADTEADPQEEYKFLKLIDQRCTHYPLQYIMGSADFMGIDFMVNDSVLIPRLDTEVLVETILDKANIEGGSFIDMCTGSGCIAVSLMVHGKYAKGMGVDISKRALDTARLNGFFNRDRWMRDGRNVDSLTWIHSNLFENLVGDDCVETFDMIVSNPPYIPAEVIETLMPEVRDHEPRLALEAADEGLEFYKKITQEAVNWLKPEGWLFYEIGCEQGEAVSQISKENGFRDIHTVKDLAGLDRVVYGRR